MIFIFYVPLLMDLFSRQEQWGVTIKFGLLSYIFTHNPLLYYFWIFALNEVGITESIFLQLVPSNISSTCPTIRFCHQLIFLINLC